MCRKKVDIADPKDTRGSAIFFFFFAVREKREAVFSRYHGTKGEINIAKCLYHIHHKTSTQFRTGVSRLTTIGICLLKAISHNPRIKKTGCEVSQFDI